MIDNKKIQIFEETCSDSEKIVSRLSDLTGYSLETTPSQDKFQEKDEKIKKLARELNELRVINSSLQISRQNTNNDDLEEIVQRSFRNLNMSGQLIRDKEQNYLYGSKKLSILLKDGQLLCRVGGIFKPFDEYIHTILGTESVPVHKSTKSSSDVQKDLEEAAKLKASSSRKHNKSLTSAPKSIKRGINYF